MNGKNTEGGLSENKTDIHRRKSGGIMREKKSRKDHNGLSYSDSGVNIDAGNALVQAIKPMVRSTARAGANGEIGGFGGVFDLKAAGFKDPLLVAANDGVGTKLRLAIESGIHDSVGIDLVAMCVNDLVVQGAEPLFFLDYLATGKLDIAQATAIVQGIAKGCRQTGVALIGGETAEMPGMYSGDDYDLAGFSVGAVERNCLLPRHDIASGDLILGLASSGLHSNGYSLVRKIVEMNADDWHSPAPFALGQTLAEIFLIPTRIYVKPILAAIRQTGAVKALAHITGGGIIENLPRILPDDLAVTLDLRAVKASPAFCWIKEKGKVSAREMLRTFNCGIGMMVVIEATQLAHVQAILEAAGETVYRVGEIMKRDGDQLVIQHMPEFLS